MKKNTNFSDLIVKTFRENYEIALKIVELIKKYSNYLNNEKIQIMHFCGTHEWTITHYGLRSLIPSNIELIAGPGCPVCVVPAYYIDVALKLALEGYRIYTYGDILKLPSTRLKEKPRNFQEAKAYGCDIKIVYSFLDAIKSAKNYKKCSIFIGIGFETITPIYSILFKENKIPENIKFLSSIRLTPPAMKYVIKLYQERGLLPLKGIIAPGHVSTITGASEWIFLPEKYKLPTVISGFEPIDVLLSIAEILKMIKNKISKLEIEYKRLVTFHGNVYSKKITEEIFEKVYSAWRGIGFIPRSGLKLNEKYKNFDFFYHFSIKDLAPSEYIFTNVKEFEQWKYDLPPRCRCGEIVTGIAKPTDCPLFMKSCTPDRPWGPCMVSSEGTCNVWAKYGKFG